jgi:[CysO sulfur-carrier protein]-S-L-cysteine hydrolase
LPALRVDRATFEEMVAHALAEAPGECCGLIAARDGVATRLYRTTNAHPNPRYAYSVDGRDLARALEQIEDAGWELGAIYHSHPHSEPIPSQTDINLAFVDGVGPLWPGSLYIIIGLARDEPDVRAFRIDSPQPQEVELSVG